jgi:hypothetical protein
MTDDNTSHLEEMKLERERDRVYGKREQGHTRNDSGGMHRRILEGLIGVAVISLVAAVWNLAQSVAILQTAQESQRRDIDRLERRADTYEGRNRRGGPDALDQQ